MSYSNYDLDQLMNNPKYQEICNMFIALAHDAETQEKVESILYEGGYNGYGISGNIGRDNPGIDIQRRVGMAYLALRNPETFDQLAENGIIYFHGTNANALPGILKYGLYSFAKSMDENIEVTTGEKSTRTNGKKRAFVSFTDVLDIAEGYANLIGPESNNLDFPVVIGTTKEEITNSSYYTVPSALPEVGVMHSFPKESITCLMVPPDKVSFVKKMAGPNMLVLPVDDIENKFYYIDDCNEIFTFDNKYKTFARQTMQPKLTGVKESIFSRAISKVKQKIDSLKGLTQGDDFINERGTVK